MSSESMDSLSTLSLIVILNSCPDSGRRSASSLGRLPACPLGFIPSPTASWSVPIKTWRLHLGASSRPTSPPGASNLYGWSTPRTLFPAWPLGSRLLSAPWVISPLFLEQEEEVNIPFAQMFVRLLVSSTRGPPPDPSIISGRGFQYLVGWEAYGPSCWIPTKDILDLALIDEFHCRHPGQPGMHPLSVASLSCLVKPTSMCFCVPGFPRLYFLAHPVSDRFCLP